MRHIIFPILALLKNTPNSISASDAATYLSMLHIVCIVPLRLIGSILLGTMPKKYWPQFFDHPLTCSRRHYIDGSYPSLIWHTMHLNPRYCHFFLLYYSFFYFFLLFYSTGETSAGDKPGGAAPRQTDSNTRNGIYLGSASPSAQKGGYEKKVP